MATTTLAVARQELSARGFLTTPEAATFATTTDIAASALLISTGLPGAGYTNDDYFGPNGSWWAFIDGTANALVSRRITAYTGSSGQSTVAGGNLAAETGAVNFELHRVHPVMLRRALNIASREAFPNVHRRVIDESVFTSSDVRRYPLPTPWAAASVADVVKRLFQVRLFESPLAQNYTQSILTNGGFETFAASAFTGWDANSITLAQVTDTTTPSQYAVLRDTSAAKCTATLNTAGNLSFTVSSPTTYDGQNFVFSVWVYCTTASRVAARIIINDATTDSANHSGTGWERLVVRAEASTALSTNLIFRVIVSSGAVIVFYVDEAIALAGPYGPAEGDDEVVRGWRIEEQVAASPGLPAGLYLVVRAALPDRHQLRLVGTDYLTQLTAEADTIEIGTPQTSILYDYALRWLLRPLAAQDSQTWGALFKETQDAINKLEAGLPGPLTKHKMYEPPYMGLPYDLGR